MQSSNGNCITEEVTEMPRCCSKRIQSEVACRVALRPLTVPAIWMAPPNSSSFSVRVVLPASGCEMIANVRRADVFRQISSCLKSSQKRSARRRRILRQEQVGFGGGFGSGSRIRRSTAASSRPTVAW